MTPGIMVRSLSTTQPILKFNLKFSDSTPPPVVASSGELVATSADGTATYTLTAGRAFVFSMSPDFQVDSTKVGDVTVYSYYYDYSSFDIPGRLSLTTSAQALQIYSQRYGPYPHKTLSVIMGNFPDGMEYSASYFTSHSYYNDLAGDPTNYLLQLDVIYLAAHETAHQWWFEQVANDQALDPGWMKRWQLIANMSFLKPITRPNLNSGGMCEAIYIIHRAGWIFQSMMAAASSHTPMQFISKARISSTICALVSVIRLSSPSFRIILIRRTARSLPLPISSASCAPTLK